MPEHTHQHDVARGESKTEGCDTADIDDTATGGGGQDQPREIGGRDGPDPTRYGDWEKAGRCIDF